MEGKKGSRSQRSGLVSLLSTSVELKGLGIDKLNLLVEDLKKLLAGEHLPCSFLQIFA
jgi:hypothetical protein